MPEAEKDPSQGVSQTGEGAAAPPARGDDLFGLALAPHPDEVESTPHKFGAGRPKGSRNRSTDDMARLVQQVGGNPLLALARVAGMSLQQIKEMLGCTRVEAFDRWVMVLDKLAPYVASKMPLAVVHSGKLTSLSLTVPLGDGEALLGPDAIAQLFAAGAQRAQAEGFDLAQLAAPIVEGGDDAESTT